MLLTKHRQLTLFSLLAITAVAAFVFAFLHFKQREASIRRAINRAAFYDRVVKEQASVTGPPLAKVVAVDSGKPLEGVIVGMTLIGPDGGDGGFQCFITQKTGIAYLHHSLTPGRYQYSLYPDPDSRFAQTEWHRNQPYVVVANDGTTTVPALKVNVGAAW